MMNGKAIGCVAMAVSLALFDRPAFADVVVTASNGDAARTYRRGARYPDNHVFILGRNDMVAVIGPGGSRQWAERGRHSFLGQRRESEDVNTSSSNEQIAATRGIGELAYLTAWDIDTAGYGGPICVANGAPMALWRPEKNNSQPVTITGPEGQVETVSIPADLYAAAWPESMPPIYEGTYSIQLEGREPIEIVFIPLQTDPDDLVETAAAMGERECYDQLQALGRVSEEPGG